MSLIKKQRYERNRYLLLVKVTLLVLVIIFIKFIVHYQNWEFITINPLFSGVVAANVFLMSFLLQGVLSDYKESERLPTDLASSLESIAQDIRGIRLVNSEAPSAAAIDAVCDLNRNFLHWFYKKTNTAFLYACANELTDHFARLEPYTQATLIARLKQEQANIRRIIGRVYTIRETSFIESGYLLAYVITFSVCIGLIFTEIQPFHESIFYVTIISYFMIFLLILIRDLDNPFEYYNPLSGEDVSLKPLEDTLDRLYSLATEEHYITSPSYHDNIKTKP